MRLSTAIVVGAVAGLALGQVGYSLFEYSFFHRGRVYQLWLHRSHVRSP